MSLIKCAYCGRAYPFNAFYDNGTSQYYPLCYQCRSTAFSSRIAQSLSNVEHDSVASASMSSSSIKRQGAKDSVPSTRKKPATSLSSDSTVTSKGIDNQPITEYPYVVPRSVWIVSKVKLSKKQKAECFAATLLYHRSYIPIQSHPESGNSARA